MYYNSGMLPGWNLAHDYWFRVSAYILGLLVDDMTSSQAFYTEARAFTALQDGTDDTLLKDYSSWAAVVEAYIRHASIGVLSRCEEHVRG